ncbi:MAG: Ada metal-binding domain-containing protein, partial [Thermodesulfobacteriota bacterium]|nr:Ada metal-binding domain-containing protein [Thermodesulfobacteriota bacterium]
MQIKRFEAKNMTEALRLIKKELGSEAVILSARSLKRESGILGALKKNGVEVTAATDNLLYQAKEKRALIKRDSNTDKNDRYDLKMQVYKNDENVISSLNSKLLFQDVNEDVAYKLTEALKKILPSKGVIDEKMMMETLVATINDMGVEFRPIKIDQGSRKAIALIGPAGVGKTTTAAKLAAVWKFQKKRDVALIVMDDHRIGAVDQIKIYSKIIGVPVEIASDKNELREAINKLKNKDLVIIDTPGLSRRNDLELEKFCKYFEKKKIETHLLLSATTKEKDFIDISERLNNIEINRLIFTKVDESSTHGNILSHLIRTRIPVSCFTCGQDIPESIEDASMDRLLSLILKGGKEKRREIDFVKKIKTMCNEDNRENDIKEYFVANQNSEFFHKPGCKWTRMIKEDSIVVFKSVSEAEQKRFKPCRYCNPKSEIKYED